MAKNEELTSGSYYPRNARETAVTTDYKRFDIARGPANYLIVYSDSAILVAWPDSGKDEAGTVEAADNAEPVPAGAGPDYWMSETQGRPPYVLVAAVSSTADVTVIQQIRKPC